MSVATAWMREDVALELYPRLKAAHDAGKLAELSCEVEWVRDTYPPSYCARYVIEWAQR